MNVTRTVFLFILFTSVSFSQWVTSPDFDAQAQRGINAVYNLEFEKANTEFSALAKTYPSHPAGRFFLAMIDWWKILMTIDDESHDDQFIRKMDDVIELCDSLLDVNDNDVSALFFKGGALGFQGRLRANRNSWIKAANDGRLALPIVQKAYKIAPDNYDILLGIGIYNYYASTIPEKYPIVKPVMVFFPTGDKVKGIEQLTKASEKAKFASLEAKYFLLQLSYNYERQYERAYELSTSLWNRFPNNVVFHRYVGRSAFSLSKFGEAQGAFAEILKRCDNEQRGYSGFAKREALYYLGMVALNTNTLDQALKYFYQCDELCRTMDKDEPSPFMTMTNLRIGMIYDLQKKRNYAVMQYQKVQKLKKFENSLELADQYLKKPYVQ
ncbi:MAG: tetratricopeptide repeat protein [Bacteroidota bacterium]